MKGQKGFTAIHIVFLLIILGAIATGYVFYQKSEEKKYNAESYTQLENLAMKFEDKINIAESTPRIGLGAALNDLATIKSEVSALQVSDCLAPAKASLSDYVTARLGFMSDFAADKIDENDPESYRHYVENAQTSQAEYGANMQECQTS